MENQPIIGISYQIDKDTKNLLKEINFNTTELNNFCELVKHFGNNLKILKITKIDDLGLKGYSIGDAMISNKHANFIINNGKATTDDIIKLINKIKKDVKDHYDIELKLEQEIIE